MDPLPAALRYERKFLAHGNSLAQVLATVRRHPALFREVYPPRAVNNLYLDSAELGDYADHVAGVANRAKTRIRWYGELAGPIAKPTLERKLRRGQVGAKLSHGLPALCLGVGSPFADLDLAAAWDTLPAALRAVVLTLRPALVNRYQRRYLLSADGRFRLTVDWDLRFLAPQWAPDRVRPVALREPAVVLELKYASAEAEQASRISGALPFRVARCSKYVLGIQATRTLHAPAAGG
jgi:hypothetical protein